MEIETPFSMDGNKIYMYIHELQVWFQDEYEMVKEFDIDMLIWAADWLKHNVQS